MVISYVADTISELSHKGHKGTKQDSAYNTDDCDRASRYTSSSPDNVYESSFACAKVQSREWSSRCTSQETLSVKSPFLKRRSINYGMDL